MISDTEIISYLNLSKHLLIAQKLSIILLAELVHTKKNIFRVQYISPLISGYKMKLLFLKYLVWIMLIYNFKRILYSLKLLT